MYRAKSVFGVSVIVLCSVIVVVIGLEAANDNGLKAELPISALQIKPRRNSKQLLLEPLPATKLPKKKLEHVRISPPEQKVKPTNQQKPLPQPLAEKKVETNLKPDSTSNITQTDTQNKPTFVKLNRPKEKKVRPKVILPHGGALIGTQMASVTGRRVDAFLGIPYAVPPVGKLRFKPPQPSPIWTGEKFADKDAPPCPQRDLFDVNRTIIGSENCLYLNVYTRQRFNRTASVMVFFHGGSFHHGSSYSVTYGPERLLDNDVVLVTSNYRLGVLGFLSTATSDCPGNNGLKDQVEVLKWVNKNIEAFGGNPKNVTIFGQDAGSASVAYHMISPKAEGLFHGAIMQSGTNLDPWAFVPTNISIARAKKLSDTLNCNSTNDWAEIVECLRTKPVKDIISETTIFYTFNKDPIVAFGPVAEPESPDAYLTVSSKNVLEPHGISIPIIIGVNSEEGALKSGPLTTTYGDLFQAKYNKALPKLLYYSNQKQHKRKKATERIGKFYFNNTEAWSSKNYENLTNLFSDRLFYSGMNEYVRNRLIQRNSTVGATFIYIFNHKGPLSLGNQYNSEIVNEGAVHGDELLHLFPFNVGHIFPVAHDARIKWAMPRMWTYFAQTGNPTPKGSYIRRWKPAKNLKLRYAHIGSNNITEMTILRNSVGFMESRMQFWRRLNSFLS